MAHHPTAAAAAAATAHRSIDGTGIYKKPRPKRNMIMKVLMKMKTTMLRKKAGGVLRLVLCSVFVYYYLKLLMATYVYDPDINNNIGLRLTTNGTQLSLPFEQQTASSVSQQKQLDSGGTTTANHNINSNYENDDDDDNDTVSACLLIMDDNHFLIEWIAYHYHAANLRRLVIAIDPKSVTSPLAILNRWKDKIDITVWTSDNDYMNIIRPNEFEMAKRSIQREFTETTVELIEHRARQRLFCTHCLRRLKRQSSQSQSQESKSKSSSSSWTLLVDVDEFVRVNYKTAKGWENKSRSNKNVANTTTNKNDATIYVSIPPMTQPGSVATVLRTLAVADGSASTAAIDAEDKSPLFYLQSSPCIPLPRYRFISLEDDPNSRKNNIAINDNNNDNENHDDIDITTKNKNEKNKNKNNNFLTQRYRNHAQGTDYKRNKISKTIIDLSRISLEDIVDVDSIHMPIRKYCSQRNLHLQPKDSLLVVNHYLGSYEQFTYRENDARNSKNSNNNNNNEVLSKVNVRNAQQFEEQQKLKYRPETDDEIRPWLEGFLEGEGEDQVLKGVGQLEPKSWRRIFKDSDKDRCALLFFGLTRSYKGMVLPSLIENVLRPNARHECDVYVHFYKQEVETSGRRNRGGNLRPDEIFLLEDAVHSVARYYYDTVLKEQYTVLQENARSAFVPPIVAFTHDTPEQFNERRSEQIRRYREETITSSTTINGKNDNARAYFPWAAKSYTNTSLDNIVKQWHSIQSAFKLMDYTAILQKRSYSRVGVFRSDALYVTPIDIASLGNRHSNGNRKSDEEGDQYKSNPRYDVNNHYFVTPSFAMNPVNDRIVYGPYEAVKIWATKRFELIEESAKRQTNPGYTMHSERFLNSTVFPAMEGIGYEHISNGDVCFLRTRADESALLGDCSMGGLVATPRNSYWNDPSSEESEQLRLSSVESIVGKKCGLHQMSPKWKFAICGQESDYTNWGDSGWK